MNIQKLIPNYLQEIEAKYGCKILYAFESGSRAWGVASPDSDWDVRMIYTYPEEAYLSIEAPEPQLNFFAEGRDLDFLGWDIRKALGLFASSNTSVYEWLQSPMVYSEQLDFRAKLSAVQADYYTAKPAAHHYLGLAHNSLKSARQEDGMFNIKKIFYVLRPLLSARWIIERGGIPPLQFVDLLDILKIEHSDWVTNLLALREQKLLAKEGDAVDLPTGLVDFVEGEWKRLLELAKGLDGNKNMDRAPLNELFRYFIRNAK